MVDKSLVCKILSKEFPWIALTIGFICVTIFACYYTSCYFRDLDDKRIDNIEDRLHRIEQVTKTYPLSDIECEHEDVNDHTMPGVPGPVQGKRRTGTHDLPKVRAQQIDRVRQGRK